MSPDRYIPCQKNMPLDMVIFIAILSLIVYFRKCYDLNLRNQHQQNRPAPPTATSDPAPAATVITPSPSTTAAVGGLSPEIVTTLPVFTYPSAAPTEELECAVCLSEFSGGEKGRLLPRCCHSFHAACVDEWFISHSTCPKCRATVELVASDWVT